jgi:hypothetical protein
MKYAISESRAPQMVAVKSSVVVAEPVVSTSTDEAFESLTRINIPSDIEEDSSEPIE